MGKWRRCDDCKWGFPSLTKLEAHRKEAHAFEIHMCVRQALRVRPRGLPVV